uniref:Ribonuclease H-like domain-containing protein n=1 Tax=Tanacetum cinerariifolium TaxID=118510 RepID=A0A6L2M7U7_TANCI|nr:ribonuclease H-like domain-containing protein [Tanacetum cinerariifolium]
MVTHFRVGTNRLTERLNLHVSSVSPLPKSYCDAFNDPNWQNAMRDEYIALIKKNWTLVLRPPDTNILRYDIVLTTSSESLLQQIIRSLHQEFAMTDLGLLNYFIGISVTHDSSGLFLSLNKYEVEIFDRAHMVNCNPSRTPVDTESKLGSDGDMVSDPTLYRSLTDLVAYSDADWASCPTTRRSTSGYYVFLEYRGVANAVAETCWLRNLLRELHTPLSFVALVYCDNVSAIYLSRNPVQHQRTKHIEINIDFVRDLVAAGQVRVLHVHSRYQYADIFTKGLPSALFEEFRSSLSVRCPSAPTAKEC